MLVSTQSRNTDVNSESMLSVFVLSTEDSTYGTLMLTSVHQCLMYAFYLKM